jgi:hypothetical protein
MRLKKSGAAILALDKSQIFRVFLYLVVPAMSAFELTTRTRRGDLGSPSICTYGPRGRSASSLLPVFLLPVGRGSWFSSAADFRFSASRTLAAALVVEVVGVGRDWPAFDAEADWCPVSGSSGKKWRQRSPECLSPVLRIRDMLVQIRIRTSD